MSRSWGARDTVWALLLLLATLLAYGPALRGGFVIDDRINVTPPELRGPDGLTRIWTELGATQQYYPVLYTAFWLEHRAWGDAVLGYHLLNVGEHVVAAWLLVVLLRRLDVPGAWLAGFLFALHPVQVESVAWIAEQKNTLSACFCLGAAIAFLRFLSSPRLGTYLGASVLFVLALGTKSVTATLPAALLVIAWWKRGGIDWRRDVRPLLPWFGAAVAMGLFSAWVEHRYVGANGADFAVPFAHRALIAARATWFYVRTMAWPFPPQFIYPWSGVTGGFGTGMLAVVAAAAAFGGLIWLARKQRAPLAVALLFVGLLFPTMGFLNVYWFRLSWVADHFAYLPSMAFLAGVAGFVAVRVPRHLYRFGVAAGAAAVVVLGVVTWNSAQRFRDHETLCRATIARNPAAWMMHHNLGVELGNQANRLAEAEASFRTAIRLKPDFADAHLNLGQALQRDPQRSAEALAEMATAVRLAPRDADARYVLANGLANSGRLEEAITHYEAALDVRPNWPQARFYLANALADSNWPIERVVAQLEAAIRSEPEFVDARLMLGRLWSGDSAHLRAAIEHLQVAHRLAPDSVDAAFFLANALAAAGRGAEAVSAYEATLRLAPELFEAHFNFGCVLATLPGRATDARRELETALRLRPDFAPAREMLNRL